jgi:hypothetical protein
MCCNLPTTRPVVTWAFGNVTKLISTNKFSRSGTSEWTRADDTESGFGGSNAYAKSNYENSQQRDTFPMTSASREPRAGTAL